MINTAKQTGAAINSFSAKPIFGRKKKKFFLGNFIATLVFLLEWKLFTVSMKFCFSQNTFFLILTFGIRSIRSPAKVGIGYYKAVNYQPSS